MSERVPKEILEELASLPAAQQRRVLEFARTLARTRTGGVPGKDLLRFAGTIPRADLRRMAKAIAEDCGRMDLDGW